MGLVINEGKTKYMVTANTQNCSKPHAIETGRYNFERVDSFTYLGSLVNGDSNVSEEITNRHIAANRSYFGLKSQFKSQLLSRKTKILVYKTLVRPILTYEVLPKISENLNIPRKPLALRTCAPRCLLLYLSAVRSANPRLYKCMCFQVLAVFFTLFSCVSANIEMVDVKEQRIYIKFCFRLNISAAETHQMLKKAFGEQALSQARTFEWFERFKDGRESVEGRKHSG